MKKKNQGKSSRINSKIFSTYYYGYFIGLLLEELFVTTHVYIWSYRCDCGVILEKCLNILTFRKKINKDKGMKYVY